MLRKITADDISHIINSLLALHVESPRYSKVQADPDYVHKTLASMIEQPNFIGTIDADLRGFMFGFANASWYTPELNACELLLYISPEYRGGRLAMQLITSFENVAYDLDCTYVRAGTSTQIHTEQTLRLYERLGYTREGNTVFKRIN